MRHGSRINPPNRFDTVHIEHEGDSSDGDHASVSELADAKIEYLVDASKSIVSENHSPDIPFRFSVNPYRGCAHACPYCYARPTHEYLGFSAGRDFETKIVVKPDAADLLSDFLARDRWQAEPITFSGVTDCYQPAERRFRLTRACLEVTERCGQPVNIVTKNALVVRDLDLLRSMAERDLVHVFVSITTLEAALARAMEPRTSIPAARLRAVAQLAEAGVPVGVMVAPVIPGLNDTEIASILREAAAAGARTAGYTLLRLPLSVEPVFREWLQRVEPLRAEKVLARIRAVRGGKLNDAQWGQRMTGRGEIAGLIRKTFHVFRRQQGLDAPLPPHDRAHFTPPAPSTGQLRLF